MPKNILYSLYAMACTINQAIIFLQKCGFKKIGLDCDGKDTSILEIIVKINQKQVFSQI